LNTGFPAGTNITTSSFSSALADSAAARWPKWMGSNVPPITPMRFAPASLIISASGNPVRLIFSSLDFFKHTYPFGVPAALNLRVQPGFYYGQGCAGAHHSRANTYNIRVIMLFGHTRHISVGTDRSAYPAHLIRRDGNPYPRAADKHARVAPAACDGPGRLFRYFGIIAALVWRRGYF
jgi:hypothetical protein